MSDVQIHWFAIVNSVVIVLFLSGESPITCTLIYSTKLFKKENMFLQWYFVIVLRLFSKVERWRAMYSLEGGGGRGETERKKSQGESPPLTPALGRNLVADIHVIEREIFTYT